MTPPGPHGVRIRQLAERDLGQMRAMVGMFAAAFEDAPGPGHAPADDAWLQRLLSSGSFIALAAVAGDDVVGGLTAYVLPKYEHARREIYLYDLAVDAAWRRRGIATALVDALRRVARDKGAAVVYVQADRGDDAAIALYSKLGVGRDVLHFDIEPAPA